MSHSKYVISSGKYFDLDAIGFRLRRNGVEIRDCIAVQTHKGPEFVVLGRHQLLGSVVKSVVMEGLGALDVGDCRIGSEQRTYDLKGAGENLNQLTRDGNDHDDAKGLGAYGIGAKQVSVGQKTVAGRFPSNLVLIHAPECDKKGLKMVGSGPEGGYSYTEQQYDVNGFVKACRPESPSNRGSEEVEDWVCEPSCPVRILDSQSGNRPGCSSPSTAKPASIYRPGQGSYQKQGPIYDDDGGASRFFKQVQNEDELGEYLERLIRS